MSTETAFPVYVAHTRTGWNITFPIDFADALTSPAYKMSMGVHRQPGETKTSPLLHIKPSPPMRGAAHLGKVIQDSHVGAARIISVGSKGVASSNGLEYWGKTRFTAILFPDGSITVPIVGELNKPIIKTPRLKKIPEDTAETPTVSVTAELRKLINKVNDIKMELDGELTFHIDEGGLLRARIQVDL